MDFIYTPAVNGQMRQWIADAIAKSTYPWDGIAATVTFDVQAEPPAPGHKDVMCTIGADGEYTVTIRAGVDQPTSKVAQALPNPASDIRTFFQECIVHELGHVVTFEVVNTDDLRTAVAALLNREGAMGDGEPAGELEDWADTDYPWEDRVVEGVAEIIKDVALDSRYRIYDNRTNWAVDKANFAAFLTALAPRGGFYDDFSVDHLAEYTDAGGGVGGAVVGGQLVATDYYTLVANGATVSTPFRAIAEILTDGSTESDFNGVGLATLDGYSQIAQARLHIGGTWNVILWVGNYGSYFTYIDGGGAAPPERCWLTLDWDGDMAYTAALWYSEPPAEYGAGAPDRAPLIIGEPALTAEVFPTLWGDTALAYDSWRASAEGAGAWAGVWPYEDPTISGGQGASGVIRMGTR